MEASNFSEAPTPIEQIGQYRDEVAKLLEFPQHLAEGFFDSENVLPTYQNEVANVQEIPAYPSKYGEIKREIYEMEDGTLYPVVAGVPNNIRSDTLIGFTTAWLTSTRGHNMRTLLSMIKHGYPTVMIGPEGEEKNHNHPLAARFVHAMRGNMHKVSHDMNRILDQRIEHMDVEPNQIIGLGESRGAMEGFGLGVEQYSGNRKLMYGDFTAPCFARKARISEVPGVLLQLIPEANTLLKLGVELVSEPYVKHYPATLHSDPEYYAKELLKVPMLLSGQAGQLAKELPEDTPMHIRIFKKDRWSQAEEWQKIFRDHCNVTLELTEGYHLDIANKTTLKNIEARLDALAESRGVDGDFSNVNFQEITKLHPYQEQSL